MLVVPSRGGRIQANAGDRIVVETTTLNTKRRQGEVIEALGEGEGRHYRVRWQDGHDSIYFPGPDARVLSEN